MKNKRGISLIVLIITIIVVIILAAVVILTLSKNNPIESAKEARFKEDVRTFQDELALYISKQYANAGGHWDGNISATNCDDIVQYIPSFTKKYEGKFIINNNNLEYTNKLDENEKEYAQNLNVKEKVLKLLPDEYQQVEYIESTGTQYIDTKIIANNILKINFKFNITKNVGNHQGIIGGGWSSTNNTYQLILNASDMMIYLKYGEEIVRISYDTSIHNIILSHEKISIDDVEEKVKSEINDNRNVYLFARRSDNMGNGIQQHSNCKVYYCKINYLNNLEKEFIPCYSTRKVTNSDGVQVPANTKGLYDTVEGKFYTNQGTGDFIAGPEV